MVAATYAEGMARGLREVMAEDERVHLMGQYFFGLTRYRALTVEIRNDFPGRVWNPPIAEVGYAGTGIGAAISGLRPIVDIATASFIFQAWPQVVNEAANTRYMTGGQTSVPVVFHITHGIRGGGAAQHSHSPQAMLMNTPGLQIVTPASARDVRGLIRAAVESDDPVVWIDHVKLFDVAGELPEEPETIPLGVADVKRSGRDVTIVASSLMTQRSLAVAQRLASEGVDAEVLDLRSIVPLDRAAILESVGRTHRLVIVDECHRSCGVAAEVAATVAESAFDQLRAPIHRVVTEDVPIPFSRVLEEAVAPTEAKIEAAVRAVLDARRPRS
jgi:pyruvate dehydrogenase E1 component beta subunit